MAKRARDDELSGRARIHAKLLKVFETVDKGFEDQRDRSDAIMDFWDAYAGVLGNRQQYNGNSKIFVPIIASAVNARRTRFVNQMFPQNGRYVDITAAGEDDGPPLEIAALLEKYVREDRLRTQIMPALCVNGDIEGQYNLYLSWSKITRHVVSRQSRPVKISGVEIPEAGEVDEIVEEEIEEECVSAEVLHDADVLVLPATANSIDEALEVGGSVTIVRRWTKAKIEKLIDDDTIAAEPGRALAKALGKVNAQDRNPVKPMASVAGIKLEGNSKVAVVYETWTKIKVDGKQRICRAFFCSEPKVLGCKLNPYWCDKVPLLSAPVEKVAGLFKGTSPVKRVLDMQIEANDALNMAMDGLPYHLAPLIAADPERVARWESLVMDIGAVWPVSPDAIKEIKFSDVTSSALQVVGTAKAQIFESLGVNPSMLPQQTGRPGAKRNQAEVALEQQVDVLTTSDAVTNIEGEIGTPYLQRALDYDHQFRDTETRVKVFGSLGARANMQEIAPIQRHHRYAISWLGVEAARNAAAIQQQIAFFGVLQKMPAQMYPGYRLNAVPLITRAVEVIYGVTLGGQLFESISAMYTVDPEQENAMLRMGIAVKAHPLDDDPKHMQAHMALLQEFPPGTPEHGLARDHIQQHQTAMQMKSMAAMAQQGGGGAQPQPGPGGGRGPQPGAQPQAPRPNRGPPGTIPQDRMPAAGGVGVMPRKT